MLHFILLLVLLLLKLWADLDLLEAEYLQVVHLQLEQHMA